MNGVGEGGLSNERVRDARRAPTVPSAPTLTCGDRRQRAGLAHAGARPPRTAARAITGYRVYRGTAANPTVALTPDLGPVASFLDSERTNGHDLLLQGHRPERRSARALASNEANRDSRRRTAPTAPSVPAGDRRQRAGLLDLG